MRCDIIVLSIRVNHAVIKTMLIISLYLPLVMSAMAQTFGPFDQAAITSEDHAGYVRALQLDTPEEHLSNDAYDSYYNDVTSAREAIQLMLNWDQFIGMTLTDPADECECEDFEHAIRTGQHIAMWRSVMHDIESTYYRKLSSIAPNRQRMLEQIVADRLRGVLRDGLFPGVSLHGADLDLIDVAYMAIPEHQRRKPDITAWTLRYRSETHELLRDLHNQFMHVSERLTIWHSRLRTAACCEPDADPEDLAEQYGVYRYSMILARDRLRRHNLRYIDALQRLAPAEAARIMHCMTHPKLYDFVYSEPASELAVTLIDCLNNNELAGDQMHAVYGIYNAFHARSSQYGRSAESVYEDINSYENQTNRYRSIALAIASRRTWDNARSEERAHLARLREKTETWGASFLNQLREICNVEN